MKNIKFYGRTLTTNNLAGLVNWRNELYKSSREDRREKSNFFLPEEVGIGSYIYLSHIEYEEAVFSIDKDFNSVSKLKEVVEKLLTRKDISRFENVPGKYSISCGNKYVKASLSYWKFRKLIRIDLEEPNHYTQKVLIVKSHTHAVNLILRAERDFKKSQKAGSVPFIQTMEQRYKSYFLEEVDEENFIGF